MASPSPGHIAPVSPSSRVRSPTHDPSLRAGARSAICIVTPGYLASTPRVLKEADALHAAGYDVRVVFSQGNLGWVQDHDREVLARAPWRWSAVRWSPLGDSRERWLYRWSRVRHRAAREVAARLPGLGVAVELAQGRMLPELARAAASERADLYIGHYPAGLAAAAWAARRWAAQLAFDAEDLHADDAPPDSPGRRHDTQQIAYIESRYLPACTYVTCASEGIGEELVRRYGIRRPTVVHNVFPVADLASTDGKILDRRDEALSLYWFSQSLGPGRGLEDAVRALSLLGDLAHLHLRGAPVGGMDAVLADLAAACGVERRLTFHAPVPPSKLLSRAVEHDVGLALEQPTSANKRLTVSNKLFQYLQAGLAVAATDVPGQAAILREAPEVGFLYPPGRPEQLAAGLRALAQSPALLARRKAAARAAATQRWSWECESARLVACVGRVLDAPRKS